jgi:hypothetical protein
MGFLPWKDRYYNMLLEQLAMGEAVKGVKAAERERKSKAAAGQAAAGAGGLMVRMMSPTYLCGRACFASIALMQRQRPCALAHVVECTLSAHRSQHSLCRALLTPSPTCVLCRATGQPDKALI